MCGLGSASDWMKQIFNQSEALPSKISMEFSRSFLRSQFSGKPAVATVFSGLVLEEREKTGVHEEKTSQSIEENQKQTKP